MGEAIEVLKNKVKQGGVFNFKELYNFLYDWICDQEYDVYEKRYSVKNLGDAKEISLEWECTQNVSDYFKYTISVNWLILGMKDAEVQRDNKKIKMNSGTLEINFKGTITRDYNQNWEKSIFKKLRRIYDQFIIRARIEEYEDKLIEDIEDLKAQCKAFLDLEGMY